MLRTYTKCLEINFYEGVNYYGSIVKKQKDQKTQKKQQLKSYNETVVSSVVKLVPVLTSLPMKLSPDASSASSV